MILYETVVAIKDENDELSGYLVDGKYNIPLDADNKDYAELLKKIEDGTVVVA